jgi:hypothetical protein
MIMIAIDENGKTDVERATDRAMEAAAELVNTPGAVVATAEVSGVALGDDLKLLTVEQGWEASIEWKSSLQVYGNAEELIRAGAYYSESSPDGEKRFWRAMGEAVRKAELLKTELLTFLDAARRFPKSRF